jgi:hypothetical protein
MEKGFLSNRNHSYYLGKDIKYTNYICKDCSQKKKVYEICKGDDDCDPKMISNLGYIDIEIGRYPIVLTTPLMVCPFGFNKGTNTLTLQFTNFKTDPEMNSFLKFIKELELKQMQYIGLEEEESDLYLSQIKVDSKMKYDPNLLLKVPFRNNSYDVSIKNKESSISITNIYKWTKLRCDIYIDKIWKFNGKYVCKWKVKAILID